MIKINQKLRQKAVRHAWVLRLFKKIYIVCLVMFILSFAGLLLPPSLEWIIGILMVSSVLVAIFTFFIQEILEEEIKDNKPLTKNKRKRITLVLGDEDEKSHFEIRYLKPGIKYKEVLLRGI